jgi:NtrC-family two-component system sensor histidine kinase KinB
LMGSEGEVHTWNTCISRSGELIPVSMSSESVRMRGGKVMGSVIVVYDLRETMRLIEAELEAEEASAEVAAERDRSETLLRSQEELKELSAFLESVIDNIAEPLWIKDRDFRFVFVNEAFCELSGFSKADIVGETGDGLASAEQADEFRECDAEAFATGQVSEIETVINDREGETHLVRTLRAPLRDDAGEAQYLVGIFTDITEQRQLENARLDFIRVAAHELRTPLTSLKLGFDLLARETRGVLDEEQQRSLDILSLSIERLSSLARNLLDLASMDAGLFTLRIERVEVKPLLEEAATVFSNTISDKGLYCSVDTDGELKPVYADPNRFSQVLYNLVSNAVKYTDSGGITISARNSGDDLLEICVADTGAGIPADLQESIFSSFVRPRDPDGREGTGLGLSITKAIVEAHGGRVWVQSRVGAGSEFFFTVRAAGELT